MRRATVNETEAILVEEWQAAGFNVFIRQRVGARGWRIYRPRQGDELGPTWEELPPALESAAVAPSLFLPADALEALTAAAYDFKPPSSAVSEHLADVIKVRDRLLDVAESAAANAPTFYDVTDLVKVAKR